MLSLSLLFACKEPAPKPPEEAPPKPVPSATAPPAPSFDGPVPNNVVMISIDTLRRDVIGRYDPKQRGLSPFLDEIAASGVAFDAVTACSNWTIASTACFLSGASNIDRADEREMLPILTNANQVVTPYPEGTPMLPSFLRPYGYSSILLSANNFFGEQHGSAQGYDRFEHVPGSALEVWEAAQAALDEEPLAEPFLLHLHLFEPHRPYLPPKAYSDARIAGLPPSDYDLSSYLVQAYAGSIVEDLPEEEQAILKDHFRAFYEAEVRWLDDQIQIIWDGLESRGLLEDTLVVIWSDHGEALWEHAYTGHAHLLYPNENDAIVYLWAKNIRPGVVQAPISTIDIVPTLFDLWQRPIPAEVTGIPYRPEPEDTASPPPERVRTAFSDGFSGPVHSARRGLFSMQFAWGAQQPIALVDLASDPDGLENLYDPASPHPVARELWPVIEAEVQAAMPYLVVDPRAPVPNWPEELMTP